MQEIGYEDCDLVSLEREWLYWKVVVKTWSLDCMSLVSGSNQPPNVSMQSLNVTLHCEAPDLRRQEVHACCAQNASPCWSWWDSHTQAWVLWAHASISLLGIYEYKNGVKKIASEYVHRENNPPRDKEKECILGDVLLRKYDIYRFCVHFIRYGLQFWAKAASGEVSQNWVP
jgi:hypothetical protein